MARRGRPTVVLCAEFFQPVRAVNLAVLRFRWGVRPLDSGASIRVLRFRINESAATAFEAKKAQRAELRKPGAQSAEGGRRPRVRDSRAESPR